MFTNNPTHLHNLAPPLISHQFLSILSYIHAIGMHGYLGVHVATSCLFLAMILSIPDNLHTTHVHVTHTCMATLQCITLKAMSLIPYFFIFAFKFCFVQKSSFLIILHFQVFILFYLFIIYFYSFLDIIRTSKSIFNKHLLPFSF